MAKAVLGARVLLIGGSFAAMLGTMVAPTAAQAGFFDQLFGAPATAPSQPVYEAPAYSAPDGASGASAPASIRHRAPKRVAEEQPVRQKTTDLMHDKTLRPGDAIMMKTGLHVYTGRESASHSADEFVRLDDASRVKPAQKIALASLDGTRNDPLAKAANPDTIASGRSAAVSAPVVTGVKFTDARGRTIRYIGP